MKNFRSIITLMAMMSFVLAIGGCLNNPKRDRFLIPQDFTGTVYVYYEVPGAEPLKMEDGYRLIVIPSSGVTRTSSALIGGKLHNEYWLYLGDKRTTMSPYKLGGGGTVEQKNSLGQQEIFFQFDVLKEERPHDTLWSILTTW
jgi:hypothetical protein